MNTELLYSAFIFFTGLIVLFFLGRTIMLWYWKIDVKLKLLSETLETERIIAERLQIQVVQNELLLSSFLDGKSFFLTHKGSGKVITLNSFEQLKPYFRNFGEYDITIINRKQSL